MSRNNFANADPLKQDHRTVARAIASSVSR
jgi:hypothetical protein